MYKSGATLVLLSIVVALVNAQCSCPNRPPVDVVYQGEACECGRKYPVQMEVPKITEHRDAHYDYGFTVERPQQPPAEIKYTFDFHMEKPKPLPSSASLATYGFEVEKPVQKEAEVPLYRFDYQVQTPITKNGPSNLEGLVAHVDRVVVQRQDCRENSGCHCNSYKPTIDHLQRCPKHGHLYRYGGPLCPSQQRYSQDSSSFQQQNPDQVLISSERPKREVANAFPIKIKELLPAFRTNNQIVKIPNTEQENRNRIAEILKKNFGDYASEDIEELLRPKPLGATKRVESTGEKVQQQEPILPKSDFITQIQPKLQEARSNLRSQITKIVNKVRLNAIKAKHNIQKRSTESTEASLSDVNFNESFDGSFDDSTEPIWITDESIEEHNTGNVINDSENVGEKDEPTGDRFRKHCEHCGELAKKFPCPSCGSIPAGVSHQQNFETMRQDESIPYAPSQVDKTSAHLSKPRYVFDRQQIANNEQFDGYAQGDDGTVGSYHNPNAYGELEHILHENSESLHLQNRRVGNGHLLQPLNLAHASDAIRFIQELTQRNNEQTNGDYYRNSYDVGGTSQNYHAKRSFEIVPLAEKDDGSVFVKISPHTEYQSELKNQQRVSGKSDINFDNYEKYEGDDDVPKLSTIENQFVENKPKANFEKFVRGGKKYEILALSANGSEEGSVGSDEDMEILKYIYAVNQKEQARENSSTETILENKSTDTNV